jgi:hypothetical protein
MTELIAGDCDKTRAKIGSGTSGGICVTFGAVSAGCYFVSKVFFDLIMSQGNGIPFGSHWVLFFCRFRGKLY